MKSSINHESDRIDNVYLLEGPDHLPQYRIHLVANDHLARGEGRAVIAVEYANALDEPVCVYEFESSFLVGNGFSYLMMLLEGRNDDDMLLEFNGASDLVDIVRSMLELIRVAKKIQFPKECHHVAEVNHSI